MYWLCHLFGIFLSNVFHYKSKEGISTNTRLRHPQQNHKHPVRIQRADTHRKRHKGTRNFNAQHRNIKQKELHTNQRDQWVTGADLGRPSATKIAEAEVNSSSERAFFNSETLVICGIVVLALFVVITFAVICGCLFLHHMNTILKRDRASNLEVKQTLEELKMMLSGAYMQLDFTRSNQVKSSRSEYTDLTSNSVEIEYETPT
ncbi:hypothetical protein FSP39_002741 [Pinctada imbricata]|uniref:Uncharacterized protein n=1 Tax=Pinctada imbricata TaxID=66713 RepID=A0AA88YHH9_PINIB|nr:hypothetical protein FSP39_002741 [Pinctada imbricata]